MSRIVRFSTPRRGLDAPTSWRVVIAKTVGHRRAGSIHPARRSASGANRIPPLAASGIPHELVAAVGRAVAAVSSLRSRAGACSDRIRPGFQESAMTSPDKSRHVEVKDGDQTVAAAEVTTVEHAEGTVRTSLRRSSGHTPPGSRASLVDAVMDPPEVQAVAAGGHRPARRRRIAAAAAGADPGHRHPPGRVDRPGRCGHPARKPGGEPARILAVRHPPRDIAAR